VSESTYTYEQLSKMTVAQLRDIAKDVKHDAVQGYTQLHKEQLLPGLCLALGIDAHVHHHVEGVDKRKIKAEIKRLKEQRREALAAKNRQQLKPILRRIHHLKHDLRKAMV
jgi:hypothetical protein